MSEKNDNQMMPVRRSLGFIALLVSLLASVPAAAEVWLLVDSTSATLSVMRGDKPVKTFRGISLGRAGTTPVHVRGDQRTPLGVFRIVRINPTSPYHRFYAFDYPTLTHADHAREQGIIDETTYTAIRRAVHDNGVPPQNTPLGGHLGIHGIGSANPRIHRYFNWTNGCIALTNEQIDDLEAWIRLGTKVVVQ